jgi:hypothetical protein
MHVLDESAASLYKTRHDAHSHSHTFYQRHLHIWSTDVIVEKILTSVL